MRIFLTAALVVFLSLMASMPRQNLTTWNRRLWSDHPKHQFLGCQMRESSVQLCVRWQEHYNGNEKGRFRSLPQSWSKHHDRHQCEQHPFNCKEEGPCKSGLVVHYHNDPNLIRVYIKNSKKSIEATTKEEIQVLQSWLQKALKIATTWINT